MPFYTVYRMLSNCDKKTMLYKHLDYFHLIKIRAHTQKINVLSELEEKNKKIKSLIKFTIKNLL